MMASRVEANEPRVTTLSLQRSTYTLVKAIFQLHIHTVQIQVFGSAQPNAAMGQEVAAIMALHPFFTKAWHSAYNFSLMHGLSLEGQGSGRVGAAMIFLGAATGSFTGAGRFGGAAGDFTGAGRLGGATGLFLGATTTGRIGAGREGGRIVGEKSAQEN
jgi:hypothetical protein